MTGTAGADRTNREKDAFFWLCSAQAGGAGQWERGRRSPSLLQGTLTKKKHGMLLQHRCYLVATCDRDLKRRLRKIPGVPIMYIAGHKYAIERLPEVGFLWNFIIFFLVKENSMTECPIDPCLVSIRGEKYNLFYYGGFNLFFGQESADPGLKRDEEPLGQERGALPRGPESERQQELDDEIRHATMHECARTDHRRSYFFFFFKCINWRCRIGLQETL
jgi:hypothetical protein